MKLTELFSSGKPIENTGKTQAYSAQNAAAISRQIKALMPGQTIQGEIIARNGSEVQIRLTDDLVLSASLEQNMNLEVGKSMTFEVKNNGRALTLSPLFANVATDANVLKALDMASLPINNNTISMTKLMMEAGLSIDKSSLQQVYREVNAFSGAEISDIVDLHRLGMEVKEGNVKQIAAYKNLTHQLTEGMRQVLDALPDTFQGMLQAGNAREAAGLYQELLALVENELSEEAQPAAGQPIEGQPMEGQPIETQTMEAQVTAEGQSVITGEKAQIAVEQPTAESEPTAMAKEAQPVEIQPVETQPVEGQPTATAEGILNTGGQTGMLSEIPLPQEELTARGQLLAVRELLTRAVKEGNTELLQTVLGGKEVQRLLTGNLQQLWTITPEEVADEKKVNELYQRLNRQLKGIVRALEASNQTASTAYQAATGMSQSIDFLQQFNQLYTYVQLPLRLQQGEAHGDLYVYTNKKSLAQKDGQISALLHLDMEHLGPVDVYVAMQAEKVNTRFYVRDDEMLGFLEAHMDLLTQRLARRGYSCSVDMQTRNKGESLQSGLIPILEQDRHTTPLVQYAFDMRA